MTLLALQFAAQPLLTKKFTPKHVNRNKVVIGQELFKLLLAGGLLVTCALQQQQQPLDVSLKTLVSGWTIQSWIVVAVVPALLYSLQGVLKLIAYQTIDGFTFNVLNQTKTLASALWCYWLLGQRQSGMQIFALVLLFASACVMEGIIPLPSGRTIDLPQKPKQEPLVGIIADEKKTPEEEDEEPKTTTTTTRTAAIITTASSERSKGVAAVMAASLCSGLAGALAQKSLQSGDGRNSYLFTMELSVASILFLLLNNGITKYLVPRRRISRSDTPPPPTTTTTTLATTTTKHNKEEEEDAVSWTLLIPMMTNAIGGVLVGLVTKQVGTVKKGFALIFGLWLSGFLQGLFPPSAGQTTTTTTTSTTTKPSAAVTMEQIVGAALASISLWMHMSYKL